MISASDSTADNKRNALDQLRQNRLHNPGRNQPSLPLSSAPLATSSTSSWPTPPAQSRDATLTSRFFPPSTPSSFGNVLVPNSSPLSGDSQFTSADYGYQPHFPPSHSANMASNSSHLRSHGPPNGLTDPLNASSGFLNGQQHQYASLRRTREDLEEFAFTDAPPPKRINRGRSEDAFSVPESPPSPELQRVGYSQQMQRTKLDATPLSSDESHTETLHAGSSRSRLVKGRQTPPPPDPSTTQSQEFTRFKFAHPLESTPRIQAAWEQSQANHDRATALLGDPNWTPTPPSPTSLRSDREAMGRVKELDEATRAQRAAVKEKGKKSMIYANRPVLDTKTPATPNPKPIAGHIASPTTPFTPAIKRPTGKRAKKLVIDSDEEEEEEDNDSRDKKRGRQEKSYEERALEYLNTSGPEALQELTGCTAAQAKTLISFRPYSSGDDIRKKLGQGKKKAGPTGISPRVLEDCTEMLRGYSSVDNILEECEGIGADIRATIATWDDSKELDQEGAVSLVTLGSTKHKRPAGYMTSQPKLLVDTVTLKEYQLVGVNWLNLLYSRELSCILADEMGLGKTIQVISFLASLKERGNRGPHLVVVPSSTLENWCREFARFAPDVRIQTYYAGKDERAELRQTLLSTMCAQTRSSDGWEVLITTYNLAAQGDDRDRKFFRRIEWNCCIYDEGHVLKNFQSQRYQQLLKFEAHWRLLLTGTPLQNNLQELVSLLNFILPDKFTEALPQLRAIFKVKGDAKVSLLSQERVSRAKKMMAPFVLRRRKDQVLKDLPAKTERIEWCEMTDLQRSIYRKALQRSRKVVQEAVIGSGSESSEQPKTRKTTKASKNNAQSDNSSNVLMDLRKAASHPMLFRSRFTDEILTKITKQLLKEPDFKKRGAISEHVWEDMSVMTDSELQVFCATYNSTQKFLQTDDCYLQAGKIKVLLELLEKYIHDDRKILIFSQFTQILDILQAVLKHQQIKYLMLTGSTPVDVRQTLVDEFTEDQSIPIFLLSTKAGGMGINLTAASVVVMFDQDFNPHNDRQAQDRAYRIGQKRDVEVVKLISKGTIEEDMLRLGETKLALDEAVAGDGDEGEESARERAMKTSLMKVLRQQLEKEERDTDAKDSPASR